MKRSTLRASQRGATLFVGLLMLVLITMLSVSAIRLSTINNMVIGNEQFQMEAEDAAAYEIDRLLSSEAFLTANVATSRALPAFQSTGGGAGSTVEGTTYSVTIPTPNCKRYRYLKISELVDADGYVSGDDSACIGVSGGEITLVGTTTGSDNSLCASALWEIAANVQIPGTGANVNVFQGVEMRLDWSEAKDACE